MTFVKYFLVMTVLVSYAHAQVTCTSVAAASCSTEDGFCLEFFEGSVGDEEAWQGMCEQSSGTYSSSPCVATSSVLKCLTLTNPLAPVMHFLAPFSRSEAEMTCNMLQGTACP